MKNPLPVFRMALLFAAVLSVPSSRAQDDNPFHLPEGVLARLGKGRFGGGDRSVVYSPDGTRLAVATDMGIWLYEARTRAEVALLKGHRKVAGRSAGWRSRAVNSMSFSPDGQTLASGGQDATVRLWDVASGQETALLHSHTGSVQSVSFSPDGQTLASWDWAYGKTVLLWDMSPYVTPSVETAIDAASPSLPGQTALLANYPNPFNSATQIAYRLAAPGPVRLELYNTLGQRVRRLVNQFQAAGEYQVAWDARDGQGAAVSSGVYLTRLEYPGGVQTRRLLLLK